MKIKDNIKGKGRKKRKRNTQTNHDTAAIGASNTMHWGFDATELEARKRANLARFSSDAKRSSGTTCKYLPNHGIVVDNTGMTSEHLAEVCKPLVGTNKSLEKDFLRLTAEPRAEDVRPPAILKKAVKMVKRRWRKGGVAYKWACEQMKAIRQDLSVQNIRNDITVDVYETHARLALENGDLNEYNQCQSQLRLLKEQGIPISNNEFSAYRMLYSLFRNNIHELQVTMASFSPEQLQSLEVKHAMDVVKACITGNYHAFFMLYRNAPHMGCWLMDFLVNHERQSALAVILKAYQGEISIRWLVNELAFDGMEDAKKILLSHGCTLSQNGEIDVAASRKARAAVLLCPP